MSTTRYIEVNSNFRDRNLWPQASEFEIPISQTGTKSITNATDPVSLSMPIFSWTSNNLLINTTSIPSLSHTQTINGNVGNQILAGNIAYSSDTTTFVVTCSSPFQVLRNYYSSLVITDVAVTAVPNPIRRIANSYYLGLSSGNYRCEVTLSNPFSDVMNLGDAIKISDPTDFSDVYTPLIFVPNGALQENAYNNYILYNETINQYRPILRYDNITDIIQLNTSGSTTSTYSSGPIDDSWSITDNFSLRTQPPTLPVLGSIGYPLVVLTATDSVITVNSLILSEITNYYKNSFIRILPFNGNNYNYNYTKHYPNNNGYHITSYSYDIITNIGTFSFTPSLSYIPLAGSPIEILPFSYDNFNPFVYTGSLVSQQDMVCYEMQLLSLTLPNYTLDVSQGGRIAFYPYIYVQISNVSATGAGLKHIIYSNNPNSTNIIFRAPIYDVQNPLSTPFVRIDGGGMTQTLKFKPNDNLFFKVIMSSGENYQTILQEYYSPSSPNPMAQITALFSFKRMN